MPYCCQCGTQVAVTDVFCARCGARQARTAAAINPDYLNGVSNRTASLLCYIPIIGWVPAIIFLASQRFRRDPIVRFHAFQGLYLFVAWLIVEWVVGPMMGFAGGFPGFHFFMPGLLKAVVFFTWIFMIIKVTQDEVFHLPLLGELAERSVSEQR